MHQPPTSPTGAITETAIALQATGSGLPLWVVVLGTCSALLGASIAIRRRTRSPSPEPATTTEPRPSAAEPSILTDEERVVDLLKSSGGRMRQSRIVERTDWSKSKVSMLLSEMEEEGAVHKLRVGRENVISLPGFEPVVTRSAGERDP
jgi:uncharacterized membrane protein